MWATGVRRLLVVATCALIGAGATGAAAQAARPADYEIGPGDVLKVVVLGQAEMTGSFTVGPDGMVGFPILGKVKASENTTLELERKLTVLLADGILKRPQVTVTVGEYGSQKVFVTGEVQRPGQYSLKADRTLLALLGDVGALGADVGHEVIVVRPPAGAATASGPAVPLEPDGGARGRAARGRTRYGDAARDDAGRAGGTAERHPGPAVRRPRLRGLPHQPPRAAVGEPREEHHAARRRHGVLPEGGAGVRDGQRGAARALPVSGRA